MMFESEYETRLRALNRLIGAGASESEIRQEALALKRDVSSQLIKMQLIINTTDHLVASFAPDPTWAWGWIAADQLNLTSSTLLKYNRGTRVPEVAAKLAEGGRVVRASEITERLRAEGENLPDKALATAIGNILHRTGQWERVGKGAYRRIEVPINGREAFDLERSQVG